MSKESKFLIGVWRKIQKGLCHLKEGSDEYYEVLDHSNKIYGLYEKSRAKEANNVGKILL